MVLFIYIFIITFSQYGEGNGNPLQYSCLENPMDGGAWGAKVHTVAKSRTRLSDFTHSLSQYRLVDIPTVRYTALDPAICNSTRHPPNLAAEHLEILHPGYLLFESRIRRIILSTAALRRTGVGQSTGSGHTAVLPSYLPGLHPPT